MKSKYSSNLKYKIYQENPAPTKPSRFRPKGWTDSIESYCREARRLSRIILLNKKIMRRSYSWVIHLNFSDPIPPSQIPSIWSTVCKRLQRQGLDALWVREANRYHKVHYHVIIKSQVEKTDLGRFIEEAMPPRFEHRWRKRIEPIKSQYRLAHYITKAKLAAEVKGRWSDDAYRKKRLLFLPNLKFKKYGTIGKFWEAGHSAKSLWAQIIEIERRVEEGLNHPGVRVDVEYIYQLFDGTVPLKRIERSVGYCASFQACESLELPPHQSQIAVAGFSPKTVST